MTTTNVTPSREVVACNVGQLRTALEGLPDDMRVIVATDDADEKDSYADVYKAEVATYVEDPASKGPRYVPEVRTGQAEDDGTETVLFLWPC